MKDAIAGRIAVGPAERSAFVILGAFLFVTITTLNLFPRIPNPNEFSRYELVVSMAERRTFSIDEELATLAVHEDRSSFGGHFYSNKAPGLSFAALPFYFLFRAFLGPPSPANSARMIYLLRLSTVSALSVIALCVFWRRLRRDAADSRIAPLVLFAAAFGTPFLIYSRSFFSHAWTASLLYLSFELLFGREESPPRFLLAGLLAGWAVLSEYPVAVVVAVLFAGAMLRSPKRGILFLAGGAPAAVLLGFYDLCCFGGILELSSRHEAFPIYRELARSPLVGFGWPRVGTAAKYLFSENRGVLLQCPFFLLLPASALSPKVRGPLARISLAAVAAYFVVLCGYENWHGGWCVGSRYLVPAVLLAAWPLAGTGDPSWGRTAAPARFAFTVGAAYSAAYFLFAGSTFWAIPADPLPGLRFYTAFWLSRGWTVPTLFGSGLAAALLAALATAIAAAAAFFGAPRRPTGALIAGLLGILAFALLLTLPPPRGAFGDRLARAMILDGGSEADPGSEEMKKVGAEARTPAQREAWREAVEHYRIRF
jgi:hypothetical protein